MKTIFLIAVCAALACGCAGARVYVYSLSDPERVDYSFRKKVAVINEIENLEEKRLKTVLEEELGLLGFEVTADKDRADLGVLFERDTVTKSELRSERVPVTTTSTGYYGDKKIEMTIRDEKIMTYSYDYILNKLWIDFYPLENGQKADLPVWQVYGGMDLNLYKKYERDTVRTMLGFYGRDYDNWVTLRTAK